MRNTLTRGEYHALVEIWLDSPCTTPKGVQYPTVWNLLRKGLIEHDDKLLYRHFWLTDAGKDAMDRHVKVYGAMS